MPKGFKVLVYTDEITYVDDVAEDWSDLQDWIHDGLTDALKLHGTWQEVDERNNAVREAMAQLTPNKGGTAIVENAHIRVDPIPDDES